MYGNERLCGWGEDASDSPIFVGKGWRSFILLCARSMARAARTRTRRRGFVFCGVFLGLLIVLGWSLLTILPTTPGSVHGSFQTGLKQTVVERRSSALIAAQGATATAITQDGYEYQGAGGKYSWPGVQRNFTLPDGTVTGVSVDPVTHGPAITAGVGIDPITGVSETNGIANNATIPGGGVAVVGGAAPGSNVGGDMDHGAADGGSGGPSSSSGTLTDEGFYNQFTSGQCTYWANYEYHRLRGQSIPWSGNAATWAYRAPAYGWDVSSVPQFGSIVVLQPGVQGTGWAGHVGVVEGINSDGSVLTSNWNVRGWGRFSREIYRPGAGVSFIWHP